MIHKTTWRDPERIMLSEKNLKGRTPYNSSFMTFLNAVMTEIENGCVIARGQTVGGRVGGVTLMVLPEVGLGGGGILLHSRIYPYEKLT